MHNRVAIIGGGISGLSCAQSLKSLGIGSVVFDTGKRCVGGRSSTRYYDFEGTKYAFDHSAQFLTAQSKHFEEQIEYYLQDGGIKRWTGNIGTIGHGERFELIETGPRYVGSFGMRSLSEQLSEGLTIQQPTWVSKLEVSTSSSGSVIWNLYEHRKHLGSFCAVVIAHNGKCADKLISTVEIPRVNNILRVSFGPTLPSNPRGMKKMQLCSLWVMVFAVSESLSVPFDGAYVKNSDVLSWVCNNSRKLGQPSGEKNLDCWTLVSTREFGAANKVPQENIPPEVEADIRRRMLNEFESLLGLSTGSISPAVCKIQLWGAAVPLNRYSAPFAIDGPNAIGVCGDWFTPDRAAYPGSERVRGASIESAFLSGHALGAELARGLQRGAISDFGLESTRTFQACDGHPLGDVPIPATAASPAVSRPKHSSASGPCTAHRGGLASATKIQQSPVQRQHGTRTGTGTGASVDQIAAKSKTIASSSDSSDMGSIGLIEGARDSSSAGVKKEATGDWQRVVKKGGGGLSSFTHPVAAQEGVLPAPVADSNVDSLKKDAAAPQLEMKSAAKGRRNRRRNKGQKTTPLEQS